MVWKVGGGDKVKFWADKWLGADSNLQQQFNQLFLISGQQNNTISNMGRFSQGQWSWDLKWRWNLFDYEQDIAVAFMETINNIQFQPHLQDTMLWKADSSSVYSTKSAYRLLLTTNNQLPEANIYKTIWNLYIPQGLWFSLGDLSKTDYPLDTIYLEEMYSFRIKCVHCVVITKRKLATCSSTVNWPADCGGNL